MFLLDVLHTQWILLGFGGGLVLMLGIVLFYTAGWRSRREEEEIAQRPIESVGDFLRWVRAAFPWILLVTVIGVAIWSILYPLFYAIVPPNW